MIGVVVSFGEVSWSGGPWPVARSSAVLALKRRMHVAEVASDWPFSNVSSLPSRFFFSLLTEIIFLSAVEHGPASEGWHYCVPGILYEWSICLTSIHTPHVMAERESSGYRKSN